MPQENLHLTLRFLGEVAEERIASVADALGASVEGMVDLTCALERLGAFPSERRARVVWAGLADPAGGLTALAAAVGERLEPLGFPPEGRAFHAHVTLARLPTPAPVAVAEEPLEPVRLPVDRLTLFRSRLGRPAPRYEALAVFPFRRAPSAPRDDP